MYSDQPYDEKHLLYRISRKDKVALGQVYRRYFRQLCFFAQKLTGDLLAAEDIVADSFLKLYEKETVFQREAQLKSFLFTVVRNAALDHLRAAGRHKLAHQDIRSVSEDTEQASDIAFIRSEALNIIYSEIRNLPPQCQEVIRLSFEDGKTIPEIAAYMKLAYKTVQNQKARGLQLLRTAIVNRGVTALIVALLRFVPGIG